VKDIPHFLYSRLQRLLTLVLYKNNFSIETKLKLVLISNQRGKKINVLTFIKLNYESLHVSVRDTARIDFLLFSSFL